jgi:hypothetical protein
MDAGKQLTLTEETVGAVTTVASFAETIGLATLVAVNVIVGLPGTEAGVV